ncbi:MAG: phospholipid carrier-dependent glycosyltransferase [Pirellulales bacterium]|nr:phospholipid carrier-dependent glycosyltransferase [Pirellulales bacterium]
MKWLLAILTLFGGVLLVQTAWFRHTKSITFDETYYLGCSLQTLHDGRLDPRLASQGVAPLPIFLNYLPALSFAKPEDRPIAWQGKLRDPELIRGPRLITSVLAGLPLLLAVSIWLYSRKGAAAAAAGAGLMAFSPSIIAHASLATTDACFALFATLALAAIAWHFRQPSRRRFVVMAAAISLAMAAKYSGVFLLPVVLVMFLVQAFGQLRSVEVASQPIAAPLSAQPLAWRRRLWEIAISCAVLVLLILPLWWALHRFSFTGPLKNLPLAETPDTSPWVQILGRGPTAETIMRIAHEKLKRPAPFDGVLYQYLHNRGGHCAFLMGQRSETGWWYFFPLAMLMKSTPVELLLLFGLLLLTVISARSSWPAFRSLDTEMQVIGIAALVYGMLLVTSRINIGHRYLLPLYPLLVIAGVDRLWQALGSRPKAMPWMTAALMAGQAVSCLAVAPHYLAYFNSVVGGPLRGWHYLVDSSIDWGQDLPALSQELKRLGYRRVALQYFGTAEPRAYGIEADPLTHLRRPLEEYEAFAVSVTNLQGLYIQGVDPFRELRLVRPVGRAGYSILIFDLSDLATRETLRRANAAMQSHREGEAPAKAGAIAD